jgi:hypothetical protein
VGAGNHPGQRQTLALQVAVLTRLRMAAASRGAYRTLRQVSLRLEKARAALATLEQGA